MRCSFEFPVSANWAQFYRRNVEPGSALFLSEIICASLRGLSHSIRVFLAVEPVDLRKSFNGLHGIVLDRPNADPCSGALYQTLKLSGINLIPRKGAEDAEKFRYKRLRALCVAARNNAVIKTGMF
ncbi:hypothetical protein EGM51_09560 [Verrucomicrobia bacterium S94]|nr:hypothetical protein EGM51_09560 [Verrucomicrobia bacterium S94]